MPLTLTISKNHTGKPSTIDLTIDNPHLLILGPVGAGKTVMCEHITNINEGTVFVYLGRDERDNKLRQARPFRAVAENNFFTHPLLTHTVSSKMHAAFIGTLNAAALIDTLNAAAIRAFELGAVLIIEEFTIYLKNDRAHFFNTVGELTEAGVHIIFTAQNIRDEGALRRLAIGNVAMMSDYYPSFKTRTIALARAIGVSPTQTNLPDTPISWAYPELAAENYPTARRGEFILRSPSGFHIATQVVPSPR